ncbi:hypothetical protein TELCIR_14344 [Teladorsagia circumcincta]|uniref:Tc1-like transposase DDE domain-containing protein n=1 Tax=Teladorsagia circumcincta TaxID=45464 RepID=A0A2G9U187_TELCI|nr:hypothetical protein TELCIR_14344 [Teladorsagia circumcincta]
MEAQHLGKLPNIKELQCDVFNRSPKDSRTSGLPKSENTLEQQECLLVSSIEKLCGSQGMACISLQPTYAAKNRPTRDEIQSIDTIPSKAPPPTVKSGSGAVTVHGTFYGKGVAHFQLIEGNPYCLFFEQDIDPKHKSAHQVIPRQQRQFLLWPSQSPNLNPIEDLWDELECQVKDLRAHSEHEKFLQLKTAQENISQERIGKPIMSMPR